MSNSLEERRRKSRNILLTAFLILVALWTLKLSRPQYSIVRAYAEYNTVPAVPLSLNTPPPAKKIPSENFNNGKLWKSKPNAELALTTDVFNGTIDRKVAVIFESRYRSSIIPLILHFGSVLGYSWPIIIYTSAESKSQFSTSSALGRYLKKGSVQVRVLPQKVFFENADSVSEFMASTWLWEDLAPAEHILIFQSDSMLCANAARSVEDYFEYDFVGAPIGLEKPKGYNGGFSLRKRSSALRVLEDWDWQDSKKKDDRFEEQWFYNRFAELQKAEAKQGIDPESEGAINLPTAEVARTFSVENIDYPSPLGVHQVHRWPKDKIAPLEEWCPEYKLCNEDQVKAVPEE